MRVATAILIFVLVLLADLSFTPQRAHVFNPQQVTRLALAWSLGEGHLDIDRFAGKTVDLAQSGDHFYADKPPGQSLLAAPVVLATRAALANADPLDVQNFAVYLTVAIAAVVAIPGALAAALVYLLCLRFGASSRNALLATAALGLGTPFLGWSTVLFVHVLSGSLLLAAFALAGWTAPASPRRLLGTGLVLGFLMMVDLTQLPAAAVVAIYGISRSGQRWNAVLALVLGGLVGGAGLLVYNALAFGSPFHLGYSDVVGFEGMKQGFFGLRAPDPGVLLQILFGLYRGLLPLAPVLILVPIGLVRLGRTHRSAALAIAGVIVCALLVNSAYFYWDGGSATGPRHLVAMLPMASIALAFVAPRHLWSRVLLAILLVAGLIVSGICVSTEMLSDVKFPAPFFDDILPRFLADQPLARIGPLLVPWLGFALLFLWPQRHKLPA